MPDQIDMLLHAQRSGGLVAQKGVGSMKTYVSLAVSLVIPCKRPLLIVPNLKLKEKTIREAIEDYEDDLFIDHRIRIITYNQLSSATGEDDLFNDAPDLIIADEGHALGDPNSARTARMNRYIKESGCKFVVMSGTLLKDSVWNLQHLFDWALKERSPLPRKSAKAYTEVQSWSLTLDAKLPWKSFPTGRDWAYMQKFNNAFGKGERLSTMRVKQRKKVLRDAFFSRLASCDGFVFSDKMSCDMPIHLSKLHIKESKKVRKAINHLDKFWERPDGKMFDQASDVDRTRKQLALGFYYYWDWPEEGPNWEWLDARSAWNRNLNAALKGSRSPRNKDTPFLVKEDIRRGGKFSENTALRKSLRTWEKFSHIKPPPTKIVWISKKLVNKAVAHARSEFEDCIIWYQNEGVRKYLETFDDITVYGGGQAPPEKEGKGLIALSIKAHGTGYNLPVWRNNVFIGIPSSATLLEQCIGRTHRPGQFFAVNVCFVIDGYGVYSGSLQKALDLSEGIRILMGQPQRLLEGEWK